MGNEKEVKIRVLTSVEDDEVENLEKLLNNINDLTKIKGIGQKTVDKITNSIKAEHPKLHIDVEDGEIDQAQGKADKLDDTEIDLKVDNITAMQAIDQIGSGFDRLKQGAGEIGQKMGDALNAAGEYEMNQRFLEMNIGADKAAQKASELDGILRSLPGDDTILQGLMSSAVAKNANMTTDSLKQMGGAAADYMAAMNKYGKSATETQQDLNNYILAGNTGEIERSPILAAHIDKLKEAKTVEERSLALQEALNQEGFGGIASQDIYINNQQKFNDMLSRGQRQLGEMFLAGTDGAMKFLVGLDESTNGAVGLAFALGGMATPITDTLAGLGQMASGIKSIKDLADFSGVTSKLGALKTAAFNVGSTAKDAGLKLIELGKNAITAGSSEAISKLGALKTAIFDVGSTAKGSALKLIDLGKQAIMAGLNALKSAGMWLIEKAQLLISSAATYAMAGAQAFLNLVMSMNPIMLVVIAIIALITVLIYLYYNVDSVRQAIDGLGQSIIKVAQWIYTRFVVIYNIIKDTLSRAWNTIVNFGRNFVTGLINSARNAVTGFINWIRQIPTIVMNEFNRTLQMVGQFISSLPQRVWEMGTAIIDALKHSLGIGSPGYMYYMLEGELQRLDNLPEDMSGSISGSISQMGSSMVHSFEGTQFSNGSSPVGGVNQTFNIEIGSVDSEERINEIVEVIRRELSWNNATAGRTV